MTQTVDRTQHENDRLILTAMIVVVAMTLMRIGFFENRTFTVQNVILLIASAAFVPVFYFASIYAQVGLGWQSSEAGLYLIVAVVGLTRGAHVADPEHQEM